MTSPDLLLTDAPGAAAEAIIEAGLDAYNLQQAGYSDMKPLAVLVRDPATGQVEGGLLGRTIYGLFYIDLVHIPAGRRHRGIGSRMLALAEDEARRRGCSTAALFTIHFQAPDFYARHGYQQLGRIDCDAPGHLRFCMTKRLKPNSDEPSDHGTTARLRAPR